MYRAKKHILINLVCKLTVIGLVIFIMIGCSRKPDSKKMFDDSLLQISIVKKQVTPEGFAYQVSFKNKTPFIVKNNAVYLSFPIKMGQSGLRTNPFKIEADDIKGNIDYVKPGDEVILSIYAPVKEVFSETKLIDLEHPSIDAKGYVLQGEKEIRYMKGFGT